MLTVKEQNEQSELFQTTWPSPNVTINTTMKTFASGAKSTVKKPRYDLVPQRAVALTAGRFQYGAERHGEKNYLKGAQDEEFITDRINHMLEHVMKFAAERKTSDLAAVLCNAAILAELKADAMNDGADGQGKIIV